MIRDSSKLKNGQKLKIDISRVMDRLPKKLIERIEEYPYGELVGWKMVDGNSFGLVLLFSDGTKSWFFEEELSEIEINTDNL